MHKLLWHQSSDYTRKMYGRKPDTKVRGITEPKVLEEQGAFRNKYFEFKKLVGRRGAPELELLAVVIVFFAPILHETLTNSTLQTPFASLVMVASSFKCCKLKSISQQKCFADCFTHWHNILNEDVHVTLCLEQNAG